MPPGVRGRLAFCIIDYFTNGDIRRYDISPAVRRGGCYAPLANVKVLKNALTVYEGTLAFDLTGKRDSCEIIHFCVDTVYENGPLE